MSTKSQDYRDNVVYRSVNGIVGKLGSSKLSDLKHAKLFSKIASVGVIIAMVLTYASFINMNNGNQAYMNWDLASFISTIFFTLILNSLLGEVYWVELLHIKKHDERQRRVFERVTKKSYFTLLIAITIAMIGLPGLISDFGLVSPVSLQIPVFEIFLCLMALQSVFAAWEKDA